MSSPEQPPRPEWQPQNPSPGPAWAPPGATPPPGWVPPQPQPKNKPGCGKIAGIGCLGLVGLFIVIGVVGTIADKKAGSTASSPKAVVPAPVAKSPAAPASAPAAPSTTPAATPSAQAPTPATPKTLLQAHGSGIKNTAEFTADGNWTLHYTYDCSSFGSQGNFIVSDETGMPLVNELGSKNTGDSPQYTPGTHHFEINSECSWTVTAVSG